MTGSDLARVTTEAVTHPSPSVRVESCQRLEVYSLGRCDCAAPVHLGGRDALLHLAAVAAGLEAAVLGEDQVMGQVRTALGGAPPSLRSMGDIAVSAARDFRRRHRFNSHSGHLLDRGLRVSGTTAGGSIVVLGTGHMARLVAARAKEVGFTEVTVSGRRSPESGWLADPSSRITLLPWTRLAKAGPFDVLVSCLGSSAEPLDGASQLPPVNRLILDLGTPRNISGQPHTTMFDIANLLDAGRDHSGHRREGLRKELSTLLDRRLEMAHRTATSPAGALRAAVERLRQREAERIADLHPELPRETVEQITRSLIARVFHRPTEGLRALEPEIARHLVSLFTAASDPTEVEQETCQ